MGLNGATDYIVVVKAATKVGEGDQSIDKPFTTNRGPRKLSSSSSTGPNPLQLVWWSAGFYLGWRIGGRPP